MHEVCIHFGPFFASVGGMIGIGNVVGIVTAVQIGGPGALLWVWVAALAGTIIKYSEIFLGLKHRVKNDRGGYDGGPMYFLRRAFNNQWIPIFVSILLCIYGVEIYQFAVVTDSLTVNFDLNRYAVMGVLLLLDSLRKCWGNLAHRKNLQLDNAHLYGYIHLDEPVGYLSRDILIARHFDDCHNIGFYWACCHWWLCGK